MKIIIALVFFNVLIQVIQEFQQFVQKLYQLYFWFENQFEIQYLSEVLIEILNMFLTLKICPLIEQFDF